MVVLIIAEYIQALNPNSLLDFAFGGESAVNDHLPDAQYLPAIEKQKQLEALLYDQQVHFYLSFSS